MPQNRTISAKETVGHAGECIRKALETWNAADLQRVAGSQQLLERAVADMQQATRALGGNSTENPKELRPILAALKCDVDRMTRVVDACAAFQRGREVRMGSTGVAYGASGRVAAGVDSPSRGGIEG